jgi:hypothetical protein
VSASDLLALTVCWFPRAKEDGKPALGDPEVISWANFADVFWYRREDDEKDGANFVPSRFKLEPDGRHVRRLKRNLIARTAITLDCETDKKTGEVPPTFDVAVSRIRSVGWTAVVYTSHSHTPEAPRYRVVVPLTEEIPHELPAPEVVADRLGLLGVLDRSKIGASSLFYLPSMPYGSDPDHHQTIVIDGAPIDAAWIREQAGAILAARQAEQDRIADEAHAEAAVRREAKIAAGFDPDDSLIEKLRSRFDLGQVLLSHSYSYDKGGKKYRHPNSGSGSYGADIKRFKGIERVFSHNGTDPLHASNLPSWCAGVKALDAFDVVAILDFGGDRHRAMVELAQRFGLSKTEERRKLAALIFKLIQNQEAQEEIEKQYISEGERLGLCRHETIQVATWVKAKAEAA